MYCIRIRNVIGGNVNQLVIRVNFLPDKAVVLITGRHCIITKEMGISQIWRGRKKHAHDAAERTKKSNCLWDGEPKLGSPNSSILTDK